LKKKLTNNYINVYTYYSMVTQSNGSTIKLKKKYITKIKKKIIYIYIYMLRMMTSAIQTDIR